MAGKSASTDLRSYLDEQLAALNSAIAVRESESEIRTRDEDRAAAQERRREVAPAEEAAASAAPAAEAPSAPPVAAPLPAAPPAQPAPPPYTGTGYGAYGAPPSPQASSPYAQAPQGAFQSYAPPQPYAAPSAPSLPRAVRFPLPVVAGVLSALLLVAVVTFVVAGSRGAPSTPPRVSLPSFLAPLLLGIGLLLAAVAVIGLVRARRADGGIQQSAMDRRGAGAPSTSVMTAVADDLATLRLRMSRIEQIHNWIDADAGFNAMLTGYIGQKVDDARVRERRFTIACSVLFLFAGWLLSAISPVTAVAQLLLRR